MRSRAVLVFALSAPLFLAVAPARAQPSPSELAASKRAAAELANGAFDAFREGRFAEAISGFEKAEGLFHAPKFLLYIARAQVKIGRLVAAKKTYESIVQEKLTTYAPPEFFSAQLDAKKELAELVPRIPTETLEPAQGPAVEVTASANPSATAPLPEASTTAAASRPGGGPPGLTWVAYGIGAAGLVTWGVFGGLTAAKFSEYNQSPTAAGLQEGQTFSLIADIGFGVTLAGAAAGTIYWLVRRASDAGSAPKSSFFLAPAAGTAGGGVSVTGRF